ncbi:DUF58 domain-containing protein [filamentous cyanobacterium LEGE 11480]|uniref:DUF58 domain-containing protein n=1 Tax=Romeriopsis navalis LEGE 11480 TaxID=2777977 RepID=A0A928Z4Y6_9CYAN|nr:DUF58 domain-containing protein [Romeriopsis navalis]MBE9031502.1 DUF58 domain-containing protein [Romeriopsis navalis LEGE 11480]
MTWRTRFTTWLETRWVNPAYSGWLLTCLAVFLFIAATNTLAGWLYVMSGAMLALLLVAAIMSYRNLRSLQVRRVPVDPVTVGDPLQISFALMNSTKTPKGLMQVVDQLPPDLGEAKAHTVEIVPAQGREVVSYDYPTERRGIYRWQNLVVRTAAPLGLFWRQQTYGQRTTAIVYPQILPIARCPLIDSVGRERSLQVLDNRRAKAANEGVTRSLRPYRWGDPMRMIHWSTSARHGELRVRELEMMSSGRQVLIAIDSAMPWDTELFEQAVTAATSLYFYGVKQQLNISLWTAGSGQLRGAQQVLRVMAGVMPGEAPQAESMPELPLIWLTQNINSLDTLPAGSRWMLWQPAGQVVLNVPPLAKGMVVEHDRPLGEQLQGQLT